MQIAILDAIPAQIALLDPAGVIRAVNSPWRTYESTIGLSGSTIGVGLDYLAACAAVQGESAPTGDAAVRGVRAVLGGELPFFSLEYKSPDSDHPKWFRMMANPLRGDPGIGAVVMHIDVTDRRQADVALAEAAAANLRTTEALQLERERLVAAQQVARIGSWETNLLTLEVEWSDETFRIFGLTPGISTPSHEYFLGLVHPEDRRDVDAAFRASFTTRELRTIEHRLLLPDGTVKHVEERWHVVADATDTPIRAVGTCQDITERKLLETQFLRAQRLESVGTLAGGIAHDLNNVLAPIVAAVELLSLDETDPERLESLTTIARSAARGAELVRQVLTFARGIDGKRVPGSLAGVVMDVHRLMRETFPKAINLRIEIPDNLWHVTGDPTQLHQVLLNLCVNARDALPGDGAITVECANLTIAGEDRQAEGNTRPGDYVRLSVSDTGMGIPPEIQERVFEPFFTTKEVGRGTGLGLSTVHSIVRSYGGFIRLTSRPGAGSRFDVFLPAGPSEAAERGDPEANTLPRGTSQMIMVVDDEEAIRSVVQRTLERFGYRVLTACDGAEAVGMYMADPKAIDLVLTDMTMPVMDGAATITALHALNPQLPIIASSGQDSDPSTFEALGSERVRFVPKPYTTATLLRTVAEALGDPT